MRITDKMDIKIGQKYLIKKLSGLFSSEMYNMEGNLIFDSHGSSKRYEVGDVVEIVNVSNIQTRLCFSKDIGYDTSFYLDQLEEHEVELELYEDVSGKIDEEE